MIEAKQALLGALSEAIQEVSPGATVPAAFESPKQPALYVDGQRMPSMKRTAATAPWTLSAPLKTGISHSFYYIVDGQRASTGFTSRRFDDTPAPCRRPCSVNTTRTDGCRTAASNPYTNGE